MAVRGWVQGCVWEPQGSELTVDAALGATVLSIENPTDFDDEGGVVSVNDVIYTYSADAVDEDAETITLDTGLTAAALIGDGVYPVSGGQVMQDVYLTVTLGDGEPVDIEVPWDKRDLWPEGDYDDPVQVLVSNDLETIESVPGRVPARQGSMIQADTITVDRLKSSGGDIDFSGFGIEVNHLTANANSVVDANFSVTGDSTTFGELHGFQVFADSVPTTGLAINGVMGPAGQFLKNTSARRYKYDDEQFEVDLAAVRALVYKRFRRYDDDQHDPEHPHAGRWYYGVIADEAEALGLAPWVIYDDSGEVQGFDYAGFGTAVALSVAHEYDEKIAALTARIERLEAS